jgi:hypothetical protein
LEIKEIPSLIIKRIRIKKRMRTLQKPFLSQIYIDSATIRITTRRTLRITIYNILYKLTLILYITPYNIPYTRIIF